MSAGETTSARGSGVAAFLLGPVVACLAFNFLAMSGADCWGKVPCAVLSYLLIVIVGLGGPSNASSPRRPAAYLLGMLAALALLAGGVAAWLGTWAVLCVAVVLVIACRLLERRIPKPPAEAPAPAAERVPYVLLLCSLIAAAVALLVGFTPAVRAASYAFAELGTAFLLGALATLALWRRAARLPGAPVVAALMVIAVALVNALSFFSYPSLLVSGSAVLQTSPYLLTLGRVFPFYVLAFVLGMPAGLLWCGAAPKVGKTVGWVAPVLAVLAAGVLEQWSYVGPYALAVALALAVAVATWARRLRGSVVLRAVTVLAGAFGIVWLLAGDPQMDWGGMRTTLGSVLRTTGPTGGPAPAGRPVSVRLREGKWRVVLEQGDVRATFLDGSLIDFTRKGGTDQLGSVRACVALGLAYAPANGPVDLDEPELGSTNETLNTLAPGRAMPEGAAKYALIVSGPGPLTAAANPLSALNTRHMGYLRDRLADGGVLALWLPAGDLHLDDLRRALATVADVFPRYDVYLVGRGAVVIAGGDGKVPYARLAGLFGPKGNASGDPWAELNAPTHDPAAQMLADAGFRDPMDLLTGYIGTGEDLKALTDGVEPYSEWRPSRPPAMALDLAEPARPAAMLALVQFRALGAGRLLGRLKFDGPAQKMVALRGFGAIYDDHTKRVLGKLGAASVERRRELLQFLQGPLARLDLMAPDQTERDARLASVLSQVGLPGGAVAWLQDAIGHGRDTFEVNVELADILDAQGEKGEAIKRLRRALALKPDADRVRGHLLALLLTTGRVSEAADVLEGMAKRKPDDVATLLELGYVYEKLGRLDDAAEMARRVLKIEPGNSDAEALLKETGKSPAEASPVPEKAPDESEGETPPDSRRNGGAT